MAITRTQIARQLYIKGGVVNPDGRRGFFTGAEKESREKGTNISPGTVGGGPNKGGLRDDNPYTGGDGPKGPPSKLNPPPKKPVKKPPSKPKETKFDKFKRTFNPFPLTTALVNKFSTSKFARMNNAKQRQNYINSLDLTDPKEKEEYDNIMSQLGGLGMDIIAGPKDLKSTTLSVPPSMLATNPMTEFKEVDGVSTLGDPGVKTVLGPGYQEYLDRFKNTNDGDGGNQQTDPCKGPNPPAYCFAKTPVTPDPVDPRTNFYGLSPRIAGSMFDFSGFADGGRAEMMDGGIMDIEDLDREAFLFGGIAKGLKKAVRGVKKLVKSPLGKAALLAAGGSFALGLGPFASGSTMFGGKLAGLKGAGFLKSAGVKNFLFKDGVAGLGNLSGKGIASIIGGASLLPLLMGPKEEDDFDIEAYYAANRLNPNAPLNTRIGGSQFAFADGGRIGYGEAGAVMSEKEMKKLAKSPLYKGFKKMYGVDPSMAKGNKAYGEKFDMFEKLFKKGFAKGGEVEPVATKTMPLLDMDGQEMDLRAEGGFVPIGRMEKADDVPARLSKNEFVFTAEAVRNAGEGDVDKGAEVMYNMMKNLESGGEVSEESQGLDGAREMFQTSQRLGEVI